jgi:sugar diacid utilization regulator/GAF domain-containing protein
MPSTETELSEDATHDGASPDALEEINGLQQIARRILSAGDLDDILFSISQETKRLLGADICGVFLREGDELVMRDCVGHLTRHIAKVRLLRGQGLAGRVLATGQHCVVNDYLGSDTVSQDYAQLVRAERIRSALGAPLRVNGELIGVLEVWRRRKSTFTDADVRRMLTLASLTSIAIHNARLYAAQKAAVEQLTLANQQLRRQNELISQSADISGAVIQALLDGGGLPAIARIVAQATRAELGFLGADLLPMPGGRAAPWLDAHRAAIERFVKGAEAHGNGALTLPCAGGWISMQRVIAGRTAVGWVCALSAAPPDQLHHIGIGQAAMAAGLHHLEQAAALAARAESVGALLWDLLEGQAHARASAAGRAKQLQIDLTGTLRVVHFGLDGLEQDRLKTLQESFERALAQSGSLKLIGARGALFVAVIAGAEPARIKAIIQSVDTALAREANGLRTGWGVSAPCAGAAQLHAAHREAATAALLVRRLGFGWHVALHEELGVLGVLLKVRNDADLGRFVKDTLSKVIAHDATHHGVLAKTVRTYFECNCAQQATAAKLHVHEKTVRYRLNRFEELSGLALNRHEDRMLVDLALGMQAIAGGEPGTDAPPADAPGSGGYPIGSVH